MAQSKSFVKQTNELPKEMLARYASGNHVVNLYMIRWNSTQFQCSILCCNTVLKVWLGLGTKSTWLGLENDHVLS